MTTAIELRAKVRRLWWIFPLLFGSLVACGAGVTTTAAQAVYASQLDACVKATPAPGPDAGVAERRAAWASYDACTHAARVEWAPLSGRDAGPGADAGADAGPADAGLDSGTDASPDAGKDGTP